MKHDVLHAPYREVKLHLGWRGGAVGVLAFKDHGSIGFGSGENAEGLCAAEGLCGETVGGFDGGLLYR